MANRSVNLGPMLQRMQGIGVRPCQVFVGETFDHLFAEARFVVENIVGNAQPVGDHAGIADIVPGAAGALAAARVRRYRKAAA